MAREQALNERNELALEKRLRMSQYSTIEQVIERSGKLEQCMVCWMPSRRQRLETLCIDRSTECQPLLRHPRRRRSCPGKLHVPPMREERPRQGTDHLV